MKSKAPFIPYGTQWITDDDIAAVIRVLKGSWLTQGPTVEAFEKALCAYTGAKYCVAVANGTAALHLAVAVLNIKKGCSGITSPITFLASANALIYNGIIPLFSDIDPQTANISVDVLAKTIRKDTKIIIPVHFMGRPARMKEIAAFAKKKKCFVIEDAAHAIGSCYPQGGRVGNCAYSDMTIFSFHPVKMITTGEGGAVMTNNKQLYDRLRCLRSHGVTRDSDLIKNSPGQWYYEMRDLGFNYRLTDIQASLGLSQLNKIKRFIALRRKIVARYNAAFKNISWLRPLAEDDKTSVYHLYVVRIDFKSLGVSRSEFMENLAAVGVGTQVHYIPVYQQPFYRKNFNSLRNNSPEAERYYEECLSLPLFPAMTDKEIERVISAVIQFA